MTDAMTTGPSPYPEPALTVRATYHASDGRVPEEIVIEVGGNGPVELETIDRSVHALARVAAFRSMPGEAYTIRASGERLDDVIQAAGAARTTSHRVAHPDAADPVAAGATRMAGEKVSVNA